jgi:hypothetical protein
MMDQGDKEKAENSKSLSYISNYICFVKGFSPPCFLWLCSTTASCHCKTELCNHTVMFTYMYRPMNMMTK